MKRISIIPFESALPEDKCFFCGEKAALRLYARESDEKDPKDLPFCEEHVRLHAKRTIDAIDYLNPRK